MSEPRYDIYFRGECLDNKPVDQVKNALTQLFKASPQTVDTLFSGKLVALKKNLDKPGAIKFKQALEKAGARVIVKAAESAGGTAAAPPAATGKPAVATPTPTNAGLDILPVGSDVLTEAERRHVQAVELDLSHLQLESPFATLEIPHEAPPPAPDVSHLSTAEPGADILEGYRDEGIPVPEPDTSYISLADAGAELQALANAMEEPIPVPDTSYITVAEVGADIDPTDKPAPPPAPDTSHIRIAEP